MHRTVVLPALALGLLIALAASADPAPSPTDGEPAEVTPALPTPPSPPATAPRRGMWVLCEGSQRVLEHRERLDLLIDDAHALGVTDLFVQVYRGGRAWFRSDRAGALPWQASWRDGERDALSVLIERAHLEGLRVHAWVNVLSLASNASAAVLAELGEGVVAVDDRGRSVLDYPDYEVPPPDRGWLRMGTPAIWLDAAHPEVAPWISATFAELLTRYPGLDGLHLDYIRYPDALPFTPGTRFGVGLTFGFGEASLARFRAETGLEAPRAGSVLNADRFDDWRREKLTELVSRIGDDARAARPGLELSAAVIADRERAYLVDFQDWASWLDAGLLDFAVPMLYTRDATLLRHGVEALAGLARKRTLWVGLGSWLFSANPDEGAWQLEQVQAEPLLGSALFSWDALREAPALRDALAAASRRSHAASAQNAP
jgi:uncharacterized lipoprotein YddW (UPF0748 family)